MHPFKSYRPETKSVTPLTLPNHDPCVIIDSQATQKSYKETCAWALISLSDFLPPSVYKSGLSHILNRNINKLF